ncbi:MAG: DUF2085 domain-containing protein [Candidatus Thermoplasmatota archaeon]|nr:DUF2085 domain-containing protein [Candidatus Thermoplasmatota archaeon]
MGTSKFIHRVPIIMTGIGMVLVLVMVLAPATLPPGEVIGLDARANAMDYWPKWRDMGPFHLAAYTFGDFNCHQKEERTLIINGNQMPVCSRDIAIFVGIILGSALLLRAKADDSPFEIFLDIMPRRLNRSFKGPFRWLFPAFVLGLLFVPTALDGGIQMMSSMPFWPFGFDYESNNLMRILTGLPMGASLGIVSTMLIMTIFSRRDDGETPLMTLGKWAVSDQ